jgi:hypothetical protein
MCVSYKKNKFDTYCSAVWYAKASGVFPVQGQQITIPHDVRYLSDGDSVRAETTYCEVST